MQSFICAKVMIFTLIMSEQKVIFYILPATMANSFYQVTWLVLLKQPHSNSHIMLVMRRKYSKAKEPKINVTFVLHVKFNGRRKMCQIVTQSLYKEAIATSNALPMEGIFEDIDLEPTQYIQSRCWFNWCALGASWNSRMWTNCSMHFWAFIRDHSRLFLIIIFWCII